MSDAAPRLEQELSHVQSRVAEFYDLARAEQARAERDPVGYERVVRRLVVLGYGYIFFLVAFALALAFFAGRAALSGSAGYRTSRYEMLCLLGVGMAYIVLRDMRVRFTPPVGLTVDSPELNRVVTEVADRLQAPRPAKILLTPDVNAAAVEWPRYGVFGGYESILILGLPLLAAISPEEGRALIAHELGHFSRAHGRLGTWVGRVRRAWEQVGHAPDGTRRRGILMEPFQNWFLPRFIATTYALRLRNEYEADRSASQIDADAFRSLLVRLTYVDEITTSTALPHQDETSPVDLLLKNSKIALPLDRAERRLRSALALETTYPNSHPALRDRLAALDGRVRSEAELLALVEEPLEVSAAEAFLDEATLRYPELQALPRVQIVPPLAHPLPDSEEDDTFEGLVAFAKAHGFESIEPRLRAFVKRNPDHAEATLLLGQILADRNDRNAIPLLERAAASDPALGKTARAVRLRLHERLGEHEAAEALRREFVEGAVRENFAERWSALLPWDPVEPPDFTEEERDRMRSELASLQTRERLDLVYAVTKVLPGTEVRRTYLIVFFKRRWVEEEDNSDRLTRQVREALSHPRELQIEVDQLRAAWVKRLRDNPEFRVYERAA